ncbi:MAG: HAD hydrolase-like protein, partial [Bacilli bacterium]|nr:HAD hydrolase-like protein [Bacilli bacterium]
MVERKFDAVVFDLDGTLLDTIEDLQQSVNKVMKELDLLGFTIDEIKRMVGLGVDILIRQVIDKRQIDDDLFDWVKNRYLWYYRSSSKNLTKPYLGIVKLLEDLEKNKIKMAVLSNKPDPETKEVVNHYFPNIAFSCVIGKKA